MSTKVSPKNSLAAFFYNDSVKNVVYKKTFNNYRTIDGKPIIDLNKSKIKKIQKKCEEGFKCIGLSSQKLEKNASELRTFLGNIERVTEFSQPLADSREKEKGSFKNFWNLTGNFLCLPISKILEILYCNLNFEKPTWKVDVIKETRVGAIHGPNAEITKESIYSKSIKLEPDITIEKPSKINAKKVFVLVACVVATLAFSILIGLGIVLKLIALKKDAVIKKDYETLKDFFKPKDRNIATGRFTSSPISTQKQLEEAFKNQNLKNTIIDTLTIRAEHNSLFCIADALKTKSTDINDLFVKTFVLRIKNFLTDEEIKKFQFKNFKLRFRSSKIDKQHNFTFVRK